MPASVLEDVKLQALVTAIVIVRQDTVLVVQQRSASHVRILQFASEVAQLLGQVIVTGIVRPAMALIIQPKNVNPATSTAEQADALQREVENVITENAFQDTHPQQRLNVLPVRPVVLTVVLQIPAQCVTLHTNSSLESAS